MPSHWESNTFDFTVIKSSDDAYALKDALFNTVSNTDISEQKDKGNDHSNPTTLGCRGS